MNQDHTADLNSVLHSTETEARMEQETWSREEECHPSTQRALSVSWTPAPELDLDLELDHRPPGSGQHLVWATRNRLQSQVPGGPRL